MASVGFDDLAVIAVADGFSRKKRGEKKNSRWGVEKKKNTCRNQY